LEKQLIPLYWIKMPQALPGDAGMHRWIWDMRYTTPVATSYEYPISAVPHATPRVPQGPLVLPGTYQIRLNAGGKVLTQTLTIKIDPRIQAKPIDLEKLFTLESKLAASVNGSAEAALQAHSIREQIDKLSKSTGPTVPVPVKEELEKLEKELGTLLNGAGKMGTHDAAPGLDDLAGEASSLYSQVGQSDAAPTSAQEQASAHLVSKLAELLPAWERLKTSSIADANRQLEGAHLPTLSLDQKPDAMPEGGDED
jgi:hypothetical protein